MRRFSQIFTIFRYLIEANGYLDLVAAFLEVLFFLAVALGAALATFLVALAPEAFTKEASWLLSLLPLLAWNKFLLTALSMALYAAVRSSKEGVFLTASTAFFERERIR